MLCVSSNFGWKSFAQEVHFVKNVGNKEKNILWTLRDYSSEF